MRTALHPEIKPFWLLGGNKSAHCDKIQSAIDGSLCFHILCEAGYLAQTRGKRRLRWAFAAAHEAEWCDLAAHHVCIVVRSKQMFIAARELETGEIATFQSGSDALGELTEGPIAFSQKSRCGPCPTSALSLEQAIDLAIVVGMIRHD